jgi:hypothetical protein
MIAVYQNDSLRFTSSGKLRLLHEVGKTEPSSSMIAKANNHLASDGAVFLSSK